MHRAQRELSIVPFRALAGYVANLQPAAVAIIPRECNNALSP
jgi:hypothetical protein